LLPLGAEQCSADLDCTSRGGAFAGSVCQRNVCVLPEAAVEADSGDAGPGDAGDAEAAPVDSGPWGCLDLPGEPLDPNESVAITAVLFDALKPISSAPDASDFSAGSYTPVPGVSLQACDILDPKCTKPITPLVVSNDAGIVNFTLPGSFTGFLEFSGGGVLPSTVYPGQLLADASSETFPLATLGANETQLLAGALGVPFETNPEAGVGSTFFQVYDCYDLGAGGALNVPAGAFAVTATLAATHRTLGTVNTIVNAGALTYAWFRVRTH
jgi:hypothetical protein